MENLTAIIITGVYTIVYVFVFFFQDRRIKTQKEAIQEMGIVTNQMRSYMQIFNVEEVKKYVALKEESVMLLAESFIRNDEKVNFLISNAVDKLKPRYNEILENQVHDELQELLEFAMIALSSADEAQREVVLDQYFPRNKEKFLKAFENHQLDEEEHEN